MSNVRTSLRLGILILALGVPEPSLATADQPPKPRARPAAVTPAPIAPALAATTTVNLLTIVPRRNWHAKPPLFAMKPHVPLSILVHHTAGAVNSKRDILYKMRSLQAYSQKPASLGNGRKRAAWADVPYHFYISADGAVAEGRDVKYSGDTNTNYDPTGHIQVVMEGNFENTKPTSEQFVALESLLVELAKKWRVTADEIRTHKNVAATLCPGRNFMAVFPDLQERVAARLR